MQIAIIIGSVREGRYTDKVAHFLHDQLALKPEVHPHIWDLAQDEVPILTNRWAKQEDPHENLPLMSQFLKTADGIILCSPEYHGSYSGVLKNAIDHFWKEFYRKPMGVVATGSGRFGGINASSEMQQLILSLGAFPMPTKLLVPLYSGYLWAGKRAPGGFFC